MQYYIGLKQASQSIIGSKIVYGQGIAVPLIDDARHPDHFEWSVT
jgi:hypothetical protein